MSHFSPDFYLPSQLLQILPNLSRFYICLDKLIVNFVTFSPDFYLPWRHLLQTWPNLSRFLFALTKLIMIFFVKFSPDFYLPRRLQAGEARERSTQERERWYQEATQEGRRLRQLAQSSDHQVSEPAENTPEASPPPVRPPLQQILRQHLRRRKKTKKLLKFLDDNNYVCYQV